MSRFVTGFNALIILVAACVNSTIARDSNDSMRIETFMLESKVFGNSRTIRVFLPPSYHQADHKNQQYPTLYLNDGFAVFKAGSWNAPEIVSRLINENKIPEIIMVGVDNGATATGGSPDQRTTEYLPYADTTNEPAIPDPRGSSYPDFLIGELMPAVAHAYRVRREAEHTAIGGSSYGGLAAFYTVIHRPGVFGGLIIESTPTFMADFRILKEAQRLRNWPMRVYIGIGTRETGNEELNKAAIPHCEQLRDTIKAHSPSTKVKLLVGQGDTHSSKAWARRLPYAIEFIFGPTAKEE